MPPVAETGVVAGVCVAGILGNAGIRPSLRIGTDAGFGAGVGVDVGAGVGELGATFDARGGAVGGVRAITTGFCVVGRGVTVGLEGGGVTTTGLPGARAGGLAATGTYTGF